MASKSIFGRALIASSFEILPDLPLPFTEPGSIPFSSKIFFAAGEAIPLDDFISNFSSESLRSNCGLIIIFFSTLLFELFFSFFL